MDEYKDYISVDAAVSCASAVLGLSKAQKNAVRRYMSTIPAMRFAKDTNVRTNADRIRAMTDEELAEWIWNVCCVDSPFPCPAIELHKMADPHQVDCKKIWLDWLKQEAESEMS